MKRKGEITNFRAFFKKIKDSVPVQALYRKYPELQTIILDGELLPWYSLGSGLVEHTYKPLQAVIKAELDALQEVNFPSVLAHRLAEITTTTSETDLPHRVLKTIEVLKQVREEGSLLDTPEKLQALKSAAKQLKHQIELFGGTSNIDYKPFSILKLVMKDGTEILPNYATSFDDIGTGGRAILDLTSAREEVMIRANNFSLTCQQSELEGIVIKPVLNNMEEVETRRLAPALKVRNAEYLRLVYGYDYLDNPTKYRKLSQTKMNKHKIRLSISEFMLGLRMLQTPYSVIDLNNHSYKEILASMIMEEEKEKTLDPRL